MNIIRLCSVNRSWLALVKELFELDNLSKYLGNSADSTKQCIFPYATWPHEAPNSLRHSKLWALNSSYSQPVFNPALAGVCAFRKIVKLVSRWIFTTRDWNLDCFFFPASLPHNCQILLIMRTKFYWDNYCTQKIKTITSLCGFFVTFHFCTVIMLFVYFYMEIAGVLRNGNCSGFYFCGRILKWCLEPLLFYLGSTAHG